MLRQSALYLIANVVAAVIGLISVMTLTRLVSPTDYGIYVIAMGIAGILSTLFFTWLRQAILRFETQSETDIRLAALVGYGLTLLLYPAPILVLVYLVRLDAATALVASAFAASLGLFELGQELLRAKQQVRPYMLGIITRSMASFTLALAVVMNGGGGLALVAAMAAGYLLVAALSARHIWQRPIQRFDRARLIEIARYGVPITASGIFVALNLTLDRFVLAALLGQDAAGAYGATADFIRQCAVLPAVSASMAIAPMAMRNHAADATQSVTHNLAQGGELLLAIVLPAVIGLAIVAPHLADVLLGPAYRPTAYVVIPIVALAYGAHVLSQQYVQLGFAIARRPDLFIWHTGLIFAINAALIIPLVRWRGVEGAAWSFLISEAAGVAIGLALTHRVYALPLFPSQAVRIAAAVLAMAIATLIMRQLAGAGIAGLVPMLATGAIVYVGAALLLDLVGCRKVVPLIRRRLGQVGAGSP